SVGSPDGVPHTGRSGGGLGCVYLMTLRSVDGWCQGVSPAPLHTTLCRECGAPTTLTPFTVLPLGVSRGVSAAFVNHATSVLRGGLAPSDTRWTARARFRNAGLTQRETADTLGVNQADRKSTRLNSSHVKI